MGKKHHQNLPPPPVPPYVDLRDIPIPWEFFAQLAAEEFDVSLDTARAFVKEMADKMDRERRHARSGSISEGN